MEAHTWKPQDNAYHSSFGSGKVVSVKYEEGKCVSMVLLFDEDNWEAEFKDFEIDEISPE